VYVVHVWKLVPGTYPDLFAIRRHFNSSLKVGAVNRNRAEAIKHRTGWLGAGVALLGLGHSDLRVSRFYPFVRILFLRSIRGTLTVSECALHAVMIEQRRQR